MMTMTGFVVDLFHSPGTAMIVASVGMLAAGFAIIIIIISIIIVVIAFIIIFSTAIIR